MKPKKTLSNWLTTRYQLIIRNEENFAEKTSMGFTYSKVILFSVILFTGLFVLSLFMSKTILAKWFDPKHEQLVLNQQLFELALRIDSLGMEVDRKDRFIANFQRVLSGDTIDFKDPAANFPGESQPLAKPSNLKQLPRLCVSKDLRIRPIVDLACNSNTAASGDFFLPPITGFVSDHTMYRRDLGVDVVASKRTY